MDELAVSMKRVIEKKWLGALKFELPLVPLPYKRFWFNIKTTSSADQYYLLIQH
jgi:hypothetical protein